MEHFLRSKPISAIASNFVTDPISVSPDAATFSGKMHAIGAMLDFTPVAALLISFALVRNEAWRPIRGRLFVTSGIMFVVMALFIIQLPHGRSYPKCPNIVSA